MIYPSNSLQRKLLCCFAVMCLLLCGVQSKLSAQETSTPTKFETSLNFGVNQTYEVTTFGGTINAGFVFPFNLYAGLELSGFYGNGRYATVTNQQIGQISVVRYTQDNSQIGGFFQLGYEIPLGSSFQIRPYLSVGRQLRSVGATGKVMLGEDVWFEPKAAWQTMETIGFVGVLASYNISNQLFVGVNLRTTAAAMCTIGYRF
jgi:hypothetical protein